MFSTVYMDISLIFIQLGPSTFGKIVRDPAPFITFVRVISFQISYRYFWALNERKFTLVYNAIWQFLSVLTSDTSDR